MTNNKFCPECGTKLDSDSREGMCSACFLKKGTVSDYTMGSTAPVKVRLDDSIDAKGVNAVDETVGRYSLIREHGKGGMGKILLVHDEHLGRDIALKELLPDEIDLSSGTPTPLRHSKEMAGRFIREAMITGQLEHPSITPVHELGRREDGTLYYTMKLVRGKTLADAIKQAKSFEERLKLLPHFVDLCQAISYAHSRGVIHRDIKPANVMIGDYGETVIVDWGLAKVKTSKNTQADPYERTVIGMKTEETKDKDLEARTLYGQVLGTPMYMSPEQARGQIENIDEKSDVYSLGVVLYEILTGRTPFEANNVNEIINKAIYETPPGAREVERKVSRDLARICGSAMARARDERIASAEILAKQIERSTKSDVYLNPLRPYLSDLVPELRILPPALKSAVLTEAKKRLRGRNWSRFLSQRVVTLLACLLMGGIVMLLIDSLIFQKRHASFEEQVRSLRGGVEALIDSAPQAPRGLVQAVLQEDPRDIYIEELSPLNRKAAILLFFGMLAALFAVGYSENTIERMMVPHIREVLTEWEVLKTIAAEPSTVTANQGILVLVAGLMGVLGALSGYALDAVFQTRYGPIFSSIIGGSSAVIVSGFATLAMLERRIRSRMEKPDR